MKLLQNNKPPKSPWWKEIFSHVIEIMIAHSIYEIMIDQFNNVTTILTT